MKYLLYILCFFVFSCDSDSDPIMINPTYGCTVSTACNYNENANTDDGTCNYPENYYDCDGLCLYDSDGDEVCDELEVLGCTDSSALNYDSNATEEDNSCLILGCNISTACNYNPKANIFDDSCEYPDPNLGNGSCVNYTIEQIFSQYESQECSNYLFSQEIFISTIGKIVYYDDLTSPSNGPRVIRIQDAGGRYLDLLAWDWDPALESDVVSQYLNSDSSNDYYIIAKGFLNSYNCNLQLDISKEAYSGIDINGMISAFYDIDSLGCSNSIACNYDSNFLIDDGSCIYPDCAGNCSGDAVIGCDGECESGLEFDVCGVCEGPGTIYDCGCFELSSEYDSCFSYTIEQLYSQYESQICSNNFNAGVISTFGFIVDYQDFSSFGGPRVIKIQDSGGRQLDLLAWNWDPSIESEVISQYLNSDIFNNYYIIAEGSLTSYNCNFQLEILNEGISAFMVK